MEKAKSGNLNMTQGKPFGLLLTFSIPLLFGNILQQMYNMVDTIVVGNFAQNGKACIAAVGTVFPVMFLIASLFFGLSQGAAIVISQFYGAGDHRCIKRAVDTIFVTLMVVSLPLTIFAIVFARPILSLMQVPPEVLELSVTYMRIIFVGLFASFGYNVNSGILQGLGNTKSPLMFLAVSTIVNIVLDLVFVVFFHWDVAGVAIATVIAQAVSFVYGIVHINRRDYGFKISLRHLEYDVGILKMATKIGLPAGLQNMLFSFGTIVLQGLINSNGTDFMAGFTAGQKVDAFAFMPIVSFASAVTTFSGQNVGAGKLDRVRQGLRTSILMSATVSIVIGAIALPLGPFLLRLFTQEAAVIEYGVSYLWRILPYYAILSALFMYNCCLRGAGSSVIPLISSVVSLWLARVPFAYLLAWKFGPENMYLSFAMGWVIGLALSAGYYHSNRWVKRIAIKKQNTDEPLDSAVGDVI